MALVHGHLCRKAMSAICRVTLGWFTTSCSASGPHRSCAYVATQWQCSVAVAQLLSWEAAGTRPAEVAGVRASEANEPAGVAWLPDVHSWHIIPSPHPAHTHTHTAT
jgi:hypothetical protein